MCGRFEPKKEVEFESVPVWMWALTRQNTLSLHFNNCLSFQYFTSRLHEYKIDDKLLKHASKYLGPGCIFSPPSPQIFYLISGSISFLNGISSTIQNKKGIFITESFTKCRRKISPSSLKLDQIAHTEVVVITTFKGVYAYISLDFSPKLSFLSRCMGDFLHFFYSTEIYSDNASISVL